MNEWTRGDFTVTCDPARMDSGVVADFLGTSYWAPGVPELQGLRRWMLATRDAHGLYERSGFTPLKNPGYFMEKHDPDVYLRKG